MAKSKLDRFKRRPIGVRQVSLVVPDNRLLLVPLGDVHLGALTCQVDKFQRAVDWIEKTDCKVILMGDLMEFATKSSVGAGWVEQVQSPQAQLDVLKEVLDPIKDKVLVLLEGNHEMRCTLAVGLDISKILADFLGVPYGGYASFVYLRVGKQNYVVHAQHACSGARYLLTKMHAAMKTAEHTDADIYLYGHTHELAVATQPFQHYNKRGRFVEMQKKYFVLTGGFLGFFGGYAEKKNMNPSPTGMANIKFYGNKRDIHVST